MSATNQRRESQRLHALHGYNILDTPSEYFFDDIVLIAALVCRTPIALITLIDEERQWFKAKIGLDITQTARELSACQYALHSTEPILIIPDISKDPRFSDNPMVHGAPHIRFYAGASLSMREGHVLGTLCVIDHSPRTLGETELQVLKVLARRVVAALVVRSEVAALQVLSATDALTGLYNRRAFDEHLDREFKRARRAGSPLSLVLFDLDHFKQFNDMLGHPAGDRLLRSVAATMRGCARGSDHLARIGGDEFAVILPNSPCDVALQFAERVRHSVGQEFRGEPAITISTGIADIQAGMPDGSALFHAADIALYTAKRNGRNRISEGC